MAQPIKIDVATKYQDFDVAGVTVHVELSAKHLKDAISKAKNLKTPKIDDDNYEQAMDAYTDQVKEAYNIISGDETIGDKLIATGADPIALGAGFLQLAEKAGEELNKILGNEQQAKAKAYLKKK